MKVDEFARQILFGNSLSDKLIEVDSQIIQYKRKEELHPDVVEIPRFPGRPPELAKTGKADFPSIHRLHDLIERAKVLHFFANHELLAMELMALALLRFPEAPESFRKGIVGIIQEEQSHLRLYLSRMSELGVQFGELPVNDYFWNCMKGMRSPLDFTVQMSLTFEQANLDFSLFFKKAIQKTGDEATTEILDRVYREEIGHVKHGLAWFNRWRDQPQSESEWQAYLRLLPLPLTAQRAKGFEFCADARQKAGFSDDYIRELRVYSGSKGRPPRIWYYNPHCDAEISRGKPGFHATEGARNLSLDLEHLPMFLSQTSDVVLVSKRPRTEWLEGLQQNGFEPPEFVEIQKESLSDSILAPKIGGIEPWGWSPIVYSAFRPLQSRLVEISGGNAAFCKTLFSQNTFDATGVGNLFSKSWSAQFLAEWLLQHPESQCLLGTPDQAGQTHSDWESANHQILEILASGQSVMAKAPYGTSGMQVRKIEKPDDLGGPLGGWIKNTLRIQRGIVVEPYLDKLFDFSTQLEIQESIELFDSRVFITGPRNEYRGTYLGSKLPAIALEHARFYHSARKIWQSFLKDLGQTLYQKGYRGPAGVDAFLWRDDQSRVFLKPLVELNPRWTMGRVAIELEAYLNPGTQAIWAFIPIREIRNRGFQNPEDFANQMKAQYPPILNEASGRKKLQSGIIFTNDPMSAKSVLTLLATLPNDEISQYFSCKGI